MLRTKGPPKGLGFIISPSISKTKEKNGKMSLSTRDSLGYAFSKFVVSYCAGDGYNGNSRYIRCEPD